MVMESYEVLRQAFKKPGCKAVAQEMKLSLSLIHQWSRGQNGHSEAVNPLERVAQLLAVTNDERLLDWLCAQRGGHFTRGKEMPALLRHWWEQMKMEIKRLLQPERGRRNSERESFGRGTRACCFRLPGGRCGWAPRAV